MTGKSKCAISCKERPRMLRGGEEHTLNTALSFAPKALSYESVSRLRRERPITAQAF